MILPQSDIRNLTGYVRVSAQIRWLRKHGWRYLVNARGRVIVATAEYNRLRPTNNAPPPMPSAHRAIGPLLSLEELRALAREAPFRQGAGVYFLWGDDELLYVGSSIQFDDRIWMHRYEGRIPFEFATFIVCPDEYVREYIETAYIRAFKPLYNRKIP